jgi:hypothetical protein
MASEGLNDGWVGLVKCGVTDEKEAREGDYLRYGLEWLRVLWGKEKAV